jgi:hypothetical protein
MHYIPVTGRGGLHLTIFRAGALCVAMAMTLPALANQSVELSWTPSVSPDVVGYNIYYGAASDEYTNEISVGASTNLIVSGLADGATYFFAAKAVNGAGIESGSSFQISYHVPTAAAIWGTPVFTSNGVSIPLMGVPGYFYVVQTSTDLVNWISLQTNLTPLQFKDKNTGGSKKRFYRALYFHH